MVSDNKTSKFWKNCEVCGEKMPSCTLRDHMFEQHPEIMRERGELCRYFDKRGMKVMGPGVLLFMIPISSMSRCESEWSEFFNPPQIDEEPCCTSYALVWRQRDFGPQTRNITAPVFRSRGAR
jgi:hypothetical protein